MTVREGSRNMWCRWAATLVLGLLLASHHCMNVVEGIMYSIVICIKSTAVLEDKCVRMCGLRQR